MCALTGNRATSKLEGEIYTLLAYVLGPGKQDVHARLLGRSCRIDMLFPALGRHALIVEYDGAHWHECKELSDRRKSHAMEDGWYPHRNNVVVRIREQPLNLLGPYDVSVPPRSSAVLCVRMTLFHLLHTAFELLGDRYRNVEDFLRASPQPLGRDEVQCVGCWNAALYLLPEPLVVATVRKPRRQPKQRSLSASAELNPTPGEERGGDGQQCLPGI